MASKQVLARVLLVLFVFLGGVSKLADPMIYEKALTESYSKLHAKVKESGFAIPLCPVFIASYSKELIFLTGVLMILGSLLVIFNQRLGIWIITLLYLSFCLVIHNPFIHPKQEDWVSHMQGFLLNLTTVAGLFFTCQKKAVEKEPEVFKGKSAWQRKKTN